MVDRVASKRNGAHKDAHDENGRFKKGHVVYSRKHRGNAVTNDLKESILGGAIAHGEDGRGKNGLLGYCSYLASKYPKNYSYLLGKLLPLVVRDGIVHVGNVTVSVTPIAAGKFLTHEQMNGEGITIDARATELAPEDEQDGTTTPRKPLTH